MRIIDDYFNAESIAVINKAILAPDFPWYHVAGVAHKTTNTNSDIYDFYYVHNVYKDFQPNSAIFNDFMPLLKRLSIKSLMRIKINMYPRTCVVHEHMEHADFPFNHKGCVLYLNTCDGYTKVGKNIVNSQENRVLLFDPSILHNSTTCTNDKFRLTVNFNYF